MQNILNSAQQNFNYSIKHSFTELLHKYVFIHKICIIW